MLYSIDRFEGNYAVLEHGDAFYTIERQELPEEASEGDLLDWTDEGWRIRHEDTNSRRQMLAERRRRMLEGNS